MSELTEAATMNRRFKITFDVYDADGGAEVIPKKQTVIALSTKEIATMRDCDSGGCYLNDVVQAAFVGCLRYIQHQLDIRPPGIVAAEELLRTGRPSP